ncbi:unnamed protein product [Hymenolepis diminuta]|uniref:G_PROTEIN_RECEP_F1_2 domain-containing protein n=1 Tax=Hymenolepis diminuta TaxID=6216 RepID=A0A0R3SVZ7_HYMDI|nr:unnamed protein product [Hymenolepis diminuta]
MSMSEISFGILIACLGIATNGGILIFSRMLGAMPKRKKYSFGGYSTDETYSDNRTQRTGSVDSSAQRRISEPTSRCLNSKKPAMLSPNPDVSLLRLSSLLSINRLEQDPYPNQRCSKPSGKTTWRSQSRRHKVYLQGLLILASSNLLTAFTLLSSALYSIYEKEANIASVVTSSVLIDTFQAVEVGAILWIAVNRAYAIHSTSRHSSRKTTANENGRPFTHSFSVTTEKHMSSCLGCCCCFCYCSRRVQNVVTSVDLEVATRSINQPPSKCLVVMRFQKMSRLCLCSLPLIVLLVAFCGSIWPWLHPEGKLNPNSELELYYYTLSTSIGVFAGLFVMPTSFLLSTNCLIYRKVAKRHKRFLLRQTSNSSKITFLIDEETASSPSFNKTEFSRPRFQTQSSIPTFTITGSSDQNLNRPLDERSTQLWDVPETSHENLPVPNDNNTNSTADYLSFLSVKSIGKPLTRTASSIDCSIDNPKRKLPCPDLGQNERRRKSMSELDQPAILMSQQTCNDYVHDSVFMRQLQRQHKRTVVVLASILIVFVVCHGPRAIWLCARWFHSDFGYHLLPLVTLWSRVCIFIDPVLYGFWGNRAYRRCLRNLCSHLIPVCGERGLKN